MVRSPCWMVKSCQIQMFHGEIQMFHGEIPIFSGEILFFHGFNTTKSVQKKRRASVALPSSRTWMWSFSDWRKAAVGEDDFTRKMGGVFSRKIGFNH